MRDFGLETCLSESVQDAFDVLVEMVQKTASRIKKQVCLVIVCHLAHLNQVRHVLALLLSGPLLISALGPNSDAKFVPLPARHGGGLYSCSEI